MLEASREGDEAVGKDDGLDAATASTPSSFPLLLGLTAERDGGNQHLLQIPAATGVFSASIPVSWCCACPFGAPATPGSGLAPQGIQLAPSRPKENTSPNSQRRAA